MNLGQAERGLSAPRLEPRTPSPAAIRSASLIATKVQPPPPRRGLVVRPRLLELLGAERLPKLTLVSAAPGWGKTTLLGAWAREGGQDRRFAWVSVDAADNDPVRFWTYVVEAVRRVEPAFGTSSLASLGVANSDITEVVLPSLINEAAALANEIVLVLDDYHLIRNDDIHKDVARLVEHMPPTFALVVATRADPPFRLARLRARGELTEIRADALRFSKDESARFLNGALGLNLAAGDVARLQARTEGWAAGLYLAALSLRGRDDPWNFIEGFAGDDRHIVDYLAAEVLDSLRDDVRSFVLHTSILDRFCADLCDAVTRRATSTVLLSEIGRSNLFVVPLDTTGTWYRYHQLFGELLRNELNRVEPQSVVAELHRRASAWFRKRDAVSEAIHHATAAGDVAEARELIARNWSAYIQRGRARTVLRWLDALPEGGPDIDPRVALARARTSLYLRRFDEVDRWAAAAERGATALDAREARSVEAGVALLRAARHHMRGELVKATAAARRAVELEADEPSPTRAMAHAALGVTLYWSGAKEAQPVLERSIRLAEESDDPVTLLNASGYLAAIFADVGELDKADALLDRSAQLVGEVPALAEFASTMVLIGRAKVLEERGRYAEADGGIERAVKLSRRAAGLVETAYGLLELAAVRDRQGARDEARALLRRARAAVAECPEPGTLPDLLARAERRARMRVVPTGDERDELTNREHAVLRLLAGPSSLRDIAAALYVSRNTVKTHTRSIYRKLGVSTRREAVERATELGLL